MDEKKEDVITIKIHGNKKERQSLVNAILIFMNLTGEHIKRFGPTAGFTLESSRPPDDF